MIEIKNFVDCPQVLPFVAERVHAQWFADKEGHSADGMLKRMLTGRRAEIPVGIVAFVNGAPAGTVSLLDSDLESRKDLTPWLAGLLVFPDYREAGVGRALVKAIVEINFDMGNSALYLYTDKPKYYERLGWTVISGVESDPKCSVMNIANDAALHRMGL